MKNKWGEVVMCDMHLKEIPDNVPAESVAKSKTKVTMTECWLTNKDLIKNLLWKLLQRKPFGRCVNHICEDSQETGSWSEEEPLWKFGTDKTKWIVWLVSEAFWTKKFKMCVNNKKNSDLSYPKVCKCH